MSRRKQIPLLVIATWGLILLASVPAAFAHSETPVESETSVGSETPATTVKPAPEFLPSRWTDGLHLLLGGGLNSTLYVSESERKNLGFGSNFKTDVAYVLNDRWAVELSSMVKFNQVDEFLVWDTLLTVGVRYRLSSLSLLDREPSYIRAFTGKAPTVIFLNGSTPPQYRDMDVDRIQFDGPVGGLAFGSFYRGENGRLWFFEVTGTVQRLAQLDGIKLDGEVPIVVFHNTTSDKSNLYSVYLTVGALIF